MEFQKMINDGSKWVLDSIVSEWSSLVWTERYADAGEFELRTPALTKTLAQLPEDVVVKIDKSDVIMVVESRMIDVNDTGPQELVVRGRTLETASENRGLQDGSSNSPYTYIFYDDGWAMFLLDRALTGAGSLPADKIPNLTTRDQVTRFADSSDYWSLTQTGDVYSEVQKTLKKMRLGLKTELSSVFEGRIEVIIYNGEDKTSSQTIRDPVILQTQNGDIAKASYLFSVRDYKNVAYVTSPIGFRAVYAPGISSSVSGLHRKVLQVDASNIKDVGNSTVAKVLQQRGRLELTKHNQRVMLGGEVTPSSKYKYKEHYDLGDLITIIGDYGVIQDLTVTEYIRMQDVTGEREYPALTLLDA